ncbi:hypothetical protein [Streptomyces sp. SID5910]|uniref:hypothetical protein n=1 Tax=Streptomyces sp. SID5910 TaxID=2690312 RepID=UPI0013690B8E|nr:hypothetical protein [Streptomyces sp. SID5910]MYR46580.1 hypothetical protein [Streptomyces sp. SID5910]
MTPGYRCTATTEASDETRTLAEKISSPRASIEWASDTVLQCLLEDVAHDFHAAFLRSGSRTDPDSDVFLCWTDERQGLADLDCCLKSRTPLSGVCTIFTHHPGRCDWEYIDPPHLAAQAQGDQLLAEMGLLRNRLPEWPPPSP